MAVAEAATMSICNKKVTGSRAIDQLRDASTTPREISVAWRNIQATMVLLDGVGSESLATAYLSMALDALAGRWGLSTDPHVVGMGDCERDR